MQLTPDNSNLQGKSKKVRVIENDLKGDLIYFELAGGSIELSTVRVIGSQL